ncbi:hypothetical protein NKR19_g1676 [Coniochaeta hoffmannii]|uniref:Uncharacterized protein n=1 Tax=Coniochaeta hoffmannii TaxID=91930 RepID=A0AA38RZD0_9PEZI|nr:hypothetical protein NKR19_g1676 [Coniochaeta hoffmannii]
MEINISGLGILPTAMPLNDNVLALLSNDSNVLNSPESAGPGTPAMSLTDSLFLDDQVLSMTIFPAGVSPENNTLCEIKRLSYSSSIDSLEGAYSRLGRTWVANPDDVVRESLVCLLEMCGGEVRSLEYPDDPSRIFVFFRRHACVLAPLRFWQRLKEMVARLRLRSRRKIRG